jgi:hypothetical protein
MSPGRDTACIKFERHLDTRVPGFGNEGDEHACLGRTG